MNLIFYWNKKIDEEYHTHMWTNRICTEKLLKENHLQIIVTFPNFDPYYNLILNEY